MSNFLNALMWYLGFCLVVGLFSFGIDGVYNDVGVNDRVLLFGDYVFSNSSLIGSRISSNSNGDYVFSDYSDNSLPSSVYVGSSSFKFVDYLSSVTNAVKGFFNFVGAPYTLFVMLGVDSRLSAFVGGIFVVLFFVFTIIFIFWRV